MQYADGLRYFGSPQLADAFPQHSRPYGSAQRHIVLCIHPLRPLFVCKCHHQQREHSNECVLQPEGRVSCYRLLVSLRFLFCAVVCMSVQSGTKPLGAGHFEDVRHFEIEHAPQTPRGYRTGWPRLLFNKVSEGWTAMHHSRG